MKKVLITGSAGLVGSEAVRFFCEKDFDVFGIDNDMRKVFFGEDASTEWNKKLLVGKYRNYHFYLNPRGGEVYNIGGARFANISILEAVELCQKVSGKKLKVEYEPENRVGENRLEMKALYTILMLLDNPLQEIVAWLSLASGE